MEPEIRSFFDKETFTVTHLVCDPDSKRAAIIDSVRNFDPKSGRTATRSADAVIAAVRAEGLSVDWILETHVHADHLTAAPYLKAELGGAIAIGAHVGRVQTTFKPIFHAEAAFATDGRQFDRLLVEGETIPLGALQIRVMETPGHTPACVTYIIGNAAFVGDTLFMPDYGTARCDFPGGDARQLYASIRKILALPGNTRLFLCHDYAPGGRDYRWESTVDEQKAENIHIHDGVDEEAFVAMRRERDAQLDMPVLILPSVQVNMRAGHLPPAEEDGRHYLKIPLDVL